ncbi:PREDICTED: ER membrane protein complex subunit 4 isoform X2 [Galeopterus variegatus]|uniref:ER membrane protein complex subunit 4 isoform X2 n=1 Tax=Galeopterus variegatus TaxID=482537 RepID=A0ABM0S132_GALVR|nr:PREDICTED: ER membrane protein complex subunit 4 isoform X2 [Galeopterus variegatus]
MTAQGGLVANRGRRFKWAIELSGPGGGSRGRSDRGSGQGDSLYPVGYLDKQVPDTSVQETDRILVEKVQRQYYLHLPYYDGVYDGLATHSGTYGYFSNFQDARKFKPEVSSGFGLSHWEPDGFGIGCLQVPVHGTVAYTCIRLVSLH